MLFNSSSCIYALSILESIGSGLESDIEDNDSDTGESVRHTSIKEYDSSIDNNLPETVTLLPASGGSKLYLVGTAHFSIESQNDVAQVIVVPIFSE